VRGLVNFAGGLRQDNCYWQSALSQAFRSFGGRTKLPSLGSTATTTAISRRRLEGYVCEVHRRGRERAAGRVRRIRQGCARHVRSRKGLPIWLPEVEKFLESLGLPSRPSIAISDVPRPPRSDFAKLEDVDAVPNLRDTGRKGYALFLQKGLPRAFAIGPSGAWGWAVEGDDPAVRAARELPEEQQGSPAGSTPSTKT